MSGKSYTMREMKNIVEYLVDHRAYAEIKGRKMWIDFANSKLTNRTWQSLKECFLQRILPDIHNPYYKLTRDQILSFRQRQDIEKSINNKLEIQTVTEDSSAAAGNQKDKESRPSTSKNKEASMPGEVPKCSKITSRISTSTETLVLDTCSEEPIRNEVEPLLNHKKSTRELITYVDVHSSAANEDETPEKAQVVAEDVQVIIDDFQTESDDSHSMIHHKLAEDAEEMQTSKDKDNQPVASVKSLRLRKKEKGIADKDKSPNKSRNTELDEKETSNKDITPQTLVSKEVPTQKSFNSTDDTQLPNNQEHLVAKANKLNVKRSSTDKSTNKRALSEEPENSTTQNKKPILKKNYPKIESIPELGNKQEGTLAERVAKNVASEIISIANEPTDPELKSVNTLSNTIVETININPCLNSVNLYAEQFSKSRCIDSDLEEVENIDAKKDTNTHVDVLKEVVILKSQSESSGEERPTQRSREITKREQKTLANLFGFTNGGYRKGRSRRDKTHSRQFSRQYTSNSSEWTSESDNEYVSPPRGRRNRQSRKILKPHSARILSLEEEGGLFVVYNKKIYPLVKDGKRIKKYLTYMQESDDEQESYWKLKYVEERKKADRLSRLLNKTDKNVDPVIRQISSSPTPETSSKQTGNQQTSINKEDQSGKELVLLDKQSTSVADNHKNGAMDINSKSDQHLKIKFMKNNEELQLEGNWTNIHPVLEQVLQIFHKGEPKESEIKTKIDKETASRQSTPLIEVLADEETRKKVAKLEEDIFKEITEKENQENMNSSKESSSKDINVTRRGRKKKVNQSSTTSLASPPKMLRSSIVDQDGSTSKESIRKGTMRLTRNVLGRGKTNDRADDNKSNTNAGPAKSENVLESSQVEEDSDIKYMFPPALNETNQSNNKSKEIKLKKNLSRAAKILSISMNSTENSMGYRDSDPSPIQVNPKRKKKLSVSTVVYRERYKNQRKSRRRSYPLLTDDISRESSKTTLLLPKKSKIVLQNSSLNSDVYNSESYQILMPKAITVLRPLDNIDEICTPDEQDINEEFNGNKCNAATENALQNKQDNILSPYSAESNHFGNSSNVSLPVSPEISIVENISVNKTVLSRASTANFPMLNEMQTNNDTVQVLQRKKYIMSAVDISIPLMEQDCGMQLSSQKSINNSPGVQKMSTDSETLLDKTGTLNMENAMSSSADSLDQRLRDLLLESAKKMTQHINQVKNKENVLEFPDIEMISEKKADKRKRCSTPRKKKDGHKTKPQNINAIIEEERTEACSNGRKSCPPVIHVTQYYDNTTSDEHLDPTAKEKTKTKAVRGRKKKDVIKVKILKPKDKTSKSNLRKSLSGSRLSIPSDSGIHDTESVLHQTIEDSIDLIHNHSETCLHANECMGDSLEIIESAKSIISINSSTSGERTFEKLMKNVPPESYCNNAQDAVTFSFNAVNSPTNPEGLCSDAVFHAIASADSYNSIITEDLSDESQRPARWYLLSEDENTNSKNANSIQKSVGANLNQIFPITCAVPDLSTITEASKEGDSRKPTLNEDGDTRNGLDSLFC